MEDSMPAKIFAVRTVDCLVLFALLLPTMVVLAEIDLHKPIAIETGLLQGVANSGDQVVAFKGIPYAAPPVGDLRWREPQPAARWEGVRDASRFGASCPQPVNTGAPPYTTEFSIKGPTNEDCLFLNVWAPAEPTDEKRAVLFYIHGGSGTHGSGSVSVYDGEELAKKGIIVVTVNFRLGILSGMGHPQLTAESPYHACGTYGMLDILAALKWVQNNIGAFGGDPSKVTICGQSSGSLAMHYLTTSPQAKGLFRAAIGASFSYDYLTKPHAIGNVWQKEQEGLKFAAAKKVQSIADLRKMSPAALLAPDPAVGTFTRNCLSSGVNVDGWSIPGEYPVALEKGLESDVPILTGTTADDYGPPTSHMKTTVATFAAGLPQLFGENKVVFAAKQDAFLHRCKIGTDQDARELSKTIQTEYRASSIFYWAKRRAKTAKAPVFTYFFEEPIPWPQHPEFGAFHSSDLAYWFNNLKMFDRPWTDEDRRVADLASSYWVNFVKSGNPNGNKLPAWEPFDTGNPVTMAIGVKPGPRPIAAKERREFYRELLEK